MSRIIYTISFLFISFFSTVIAGQAKHVVTNDQTKFDGIELGVKPGDTIYIAAGSRADLCFSNITGSESNPVIIINQGGKVVVNSTKHYGILFENSVHFRITGTGSKEEYGIEIASSQSQGLSVTEFSSNCEADHLEIHHVGFAGIMAKTDPNCTRKDLRYFTMKNLSFHDNLIYETGGEGFYVGFSWFPIRPYRCEEDSILYAHEIHGIRIYNNTLKDTHWDALQVGSSPRDVKIYNNSISGYGKDNHLWQNNGVQIGAGTTGDFFNNIINSGSGDGISFFGGGGNRLYNNVIINAGASAIFHNDRVANKERSYQIMNNTIINPAKFGITIISSFTWTNKLYNNVVVINNPENGILGYVDSRWYSGNNKVYSKIEDAGFNDPNSLDFRLKPESELVNGGYFIPWLKFDNGFKTRQQNDSTDIGAFRFGKAPLAISTFPFEKNCETDLILVPQTDDGKYSFNISCENVEAKIYDGTGVMLDKSFIQKKSGKLEIDLSSMQTGIYYVSVDVSKGKTELRRIIRR